MKNKDLLVKGILLTLLLGNPEFAEAEPAESFRTKEYHALGKNALDVINAADAYAQGYTGKGIYIGVCDCPTNFAHPEFSKKDDSNMINVTGDGIYDWSVMEHGTHISAIIAANKDDAGMHGVAFDANIKASSVGLSYDKYGAWRKAQPGIYEEYLEHPEVKIINNSWGSEIYLADILREQAYDQVAEYLIKDNVYRASLDANKADKLLLFSAGNSGHPTPGLENVMFTFNRDLKDNIISVGAINSGTFVRNQTGGFDVNSCSIANFNDLAKFAEDNTVTAPGVGIKSANSNFASDGELFVDENGTSMATAVVSGVGALVQQAFPYMGGKQIGDVLLSTANNNLVNKDGYYLTVQEDISGDPTKFPYSINIYFTNDEAGRLARRKPVSELVENYYEKNANYINQKLKFKDDMSFTTWAKKLDSANYVNFYDETPIEAVFGQGVVDAKKAVNGPAALNVRRMTKYDVSDNYTINGKQERQALYTIDTKGYDSTWSNDIKEIRVGKIDRYPLGSDHIDFDGVDSDIKDLRERWRYYATSWVQNLQEQYMGKRYINEHEEFYKKSGLIGLHAGLVKRGEGVLNLDGQNTYKGSTIVAEGILQINGSVAGDVYTEGNGILAGNGVIGNNVYNNGILYGGTFDGVGTLTINGSLQGDGSIFINSNNERTSKIVVGGDIDISNMQIVLSGKLAPNLEKSVFIESKKKDKVETVTMNDSIIRLNMGIDEDDAVDAPLPPENLVDDVEPASVSYDVSGLMNVNIEVDGKQGRISTEAQNKTGVHQDTFTALNSLFSELPDDKKSEATDLFMLDKDDSALLLNQLTGGIYADMAHDIMKNRDIDNLMSEQDKLSRIDSVWAKIDKHWDKSDNLKSTGQNIAVGKDFIADEDKYIGGVFSYSKNSLNNKMDSGKYQNYNIGIYAGSKNRANTLSGYVNYGMQKNDVTRDLSVAQSFAKGKYDSNTFGLGVKYAYDLDFDKNSNGSKSVYGKLNYTRYNQDAVNEKNADVYNQKLSSYNDNYLASEVGVDFNYEKNNSNYGVNIGYKHIFTGANQTMQASFAQDKMNTEFVMHNVEDNKDYLVLGGYINHKLSDKWSAFGSAKQEIAKSTNNRVFNLGLNYQF